MDSDHVQFSPKVLAACRTVFLPLFVCRSWSTKGKGIRRIYIFSQQQRHILTTSVAFQVVLSAFSLAGGNAKTRSSVYLLLERRVVLCEKSWHSWTLGQQLYPGKYNCTEQFICASWIIADACCAWTFIWGILLGWLAEFHTRQAAPKYRLGWNWTRLFCIRFH